MQAFEPLEWSSATASAATRAHTLLLEAVDPHGRAEVVDCAARISQSWWPRVFRGEVGGHGVNAVVQVCLGD